MPSRWEILLAGPAGWAIPLTAPLAVVSKWLDDPPATGAAGRGSGGSEHNGQARKWAFAPMRVVRPAEPASAGAILVLQVRLLDDNLADQLRAATSAGHRVRMGVHDYQISQPAHLVEQASWQSLRRWSGQRAWQIRFLTPTCFRRGSRTSPWPAPEPVARGLTDRWQRMHPDTAPPTPPPGIGPVWVSDIDGHSEVHTLTRNIRRANRRHQEEETISGFTGRFRYVCNCGTEDEAATFNALMAFAAGLGSWVPGVG
jgi:CRISPR-associated endoribonuclease Cas6